MSWSLVQKSAAVTAVGAGTTVTPTLPGNSAPGTLLVATLINSQGTATWTLPAGWVQAAAVQNGGISHSEIWYFAGNPGGIASVLCTSSISGNLKAALAEYSVGFSPVNLNATFETDATGWTRILGAGTLVQDATHVHTGSFAGKITPDGVTATPFILCNGLVSPGQTVTFAPWLFVAGGPATMSVFIQFFTLGGTFLGQATTSASVTTAFQQLVASATTPAGTQVYNALIQYAGTPANTVLCWVDDAQVYTVVPPPTEPTGTGIAGAVASCPVTTGSAPVAAGDLAVCCFHEHFTAASAVTWTDPAGFTLLQSDGASGGNHLYGAYNLSAPVGAITVTGKTNVASDASHGWAGTVAEFAIAAPPPVTGQPGTAGLVGTFCNQNIFGAGTTVQQAIADWQNLTSRPMTVRRIYFSHTWPASVTNDIIADAAAGRKIAISFRPAHNPPTNADAANLDQFLASCKAAGAVMDVALYSEAYTASRPGGIDAGMTPAQTIAATQFYAPTVRQYYPLVFNTGSFGVTQGENNWYAGDAYIDKIATDFYCSSWVGGDRLDGAASLANAANPKKPFGVWEFNSSRAINPATGNPYQTQAQSTAYFAYLQSYFAGRLAAGLTNADLILFNSDGGSQALNSSITDPADYRIPLWQSLFDAVNGGTGPVNQLSMSSEIDVGIDVTTTLTTTVPVIPPAPGSQQTAFFPQLFVELAMPAASPVAAPSVFILDDPVFGKLDSARLGKADTQVDVAGFLRAPCSIVRPGTRVQGPLITYQAGTFTGNLDNSDGRFDPDNPGSPYVAAGVSQIKAMTPVRVRAYWNGVQYYLYSGFADGWQEAPVTYDEGYSEVTLTATDGFKVLAGITLPPLLDTSGNPAPVGTGETSGARIVRILNAASWYTDHRKIAGGDTAVQGTALGDTVLNLLQVTADSEIGELYIDGQGFLVFRNRHAILLDARSNTPQGVFGDLPGGYGSIYGPLYGSEIPYAAVGRANDDTTIANDVQITRVGGVLQEVRNTASIARNLFPRTYARTDLILQTDTDALNYAGWIIAVASDPENRFDTIQIDPLADPVNLYPQVLGRQIGDRITIVRRPVSSGAVVAKDCFIRGIQHDIDPGMGTWLTTWTLQDASKYASFLILDHPVFGKLDSNKLSY